jgi:lysophospholipid acyltransferase (LPLAT)-like uncharacterized protein
VLAILAFFASLVIRLLRLTWRVRLSGPEPVADRPRVFCFWHGRQAGLLAYPRPRPTAVLSSLSRDGALQAKILSRLGLTVLRGSSSRGGAKGLRALVGAIRDGADAAFAVDGPRGPLHRVKPGAVLAAQQGGATLVPITSRASRAWVFDKAWDRYHLPKPFARVEITRGSPIAVDDAGVDSARNELQRALVGLEGA